MSREIARNEVVIARKAFGSIAFMLWGVIPMHVLGWLVSTIRRYPLLEAEIRHEPLYLILLNLQVRAKNLELMLWLIFLCVFVFCLFYLSLLRKKGHSALGGWLARARVVTRKIFIPLFLNAVAFATGAISGGSFMGLVLLVIFALIAVIAHYVIDTTEIDYDGN